LCQRCLFFRWKIGLFSPIYSHALLRQNCKRGYRYCPLEAFIRPPSRWCCNWTALSVDVDWRKLQPNNQQG
jgi:hypothetical protein